MTLVAVGFAVAGAVVAVDAGAVFADYDTLT
jgi:hypothetical protein